MEPLKTERLSGCWFMDISERGQVVSSLFSRFAAQQRLASHFPSIFTPLINGTAATAAA